MTTDLWSCWESFNRLEKSNQEKSERVNVLEEEWKTKTNELKQIRQKTSQVLADLDSKQSLLDSLSAEGRITRKRLELTQLMSDALDQDLDALISRKDAAIRENHGLITTVRDKIRMSCSGINNNFERLMRAQSDRKVREDAAVEEKRKGLDQIRTRTFDFRDKVRRRQEALEELDNVRASNKVYAERMEECERERERMRCKEEGLVRPEVVGQHQIEMRRLQERLEELRRVREGLGERRRRTTDHPGSGESLVPESGAKEVEKWSSSSSSPGFYKLSLGNNPQQSGRSFVFRPIPKK